MTVPLTAPLPYQEFRAGVTYWETAQELRREARQAFDLEGRRMFWTRRTVLGRMMQRKGETYAAYLAWHRTEAARA